MSASSATSTEADFEKYVSVCVPSIGAPKPSPSWTRHFPSWNATRPFWRPRVVRKSGPGSSEISSASRLESVLRICLICNRLSGRRFRCMPYSYSRELYKSVCTYPAKMLIVFGMHRKRNRFSTVVEECLFCRRPTPHDYSALKKAAHVMWIPLFPLGSELMTRCQHCGNEWKGTSAPPDTSFYAYAGLVALLYGSNLIGAMTGFLPYT